MANGKTHDFSVVVAAIAIAPFSPPIAAGVAIGGLFLSPDMDCPQARPVKRWGLLRIYWIPFQQLFPHRGRAFLGRGPAHIPGIGLLLRLLWLSPFLVPALLFMSFAPPVGFWIGLFVADLIHLFLDWIG